MSFNVRFSLPPVPPAEFDLRVVEDILGRDRTLFETSEVRPYVVIVRGVVEERLAELVNPILEVLTRQDVSCIVEILRRKDFPTDLYGVILDWTNVNFLTRLKTSI